MPEEATTAPAEEATEAATPTLDALAAELGVSVDDLKAALGEMLGTDAEEEEIDTDALAAEALKR